MLQAARLAPNLLREASDSVVEFLLGQLHADGGGKDRSGRSDLYYTVFVLEGLQALGIELPGEATMSYLRGFGGGAELDFIHRCCLARCWASMPAGSIDTARSILQRIEEYRSTDGGYGTKPGGESGTVYHGFLALGAYEDLDHELPDPAGLGRCVRALQIGDGGFGNEHGLKFAATNTTAAAAILLTELELPVSQAVGDWLVARCDRRGGFLANPNAPIPDLLSTATALHALVRLDVSLDEAKSTCLDFLDSLWTGRAFRGHWADDTEDCEYTYYGLLALGHLSS